ncbi:MAG: ATP-binding cassette domain-containing protein, partial [Rikenellaceae bacterium]
IDQILDMSVEKAIEFFSAEQTTINNKIVEKLNALQNVGLGYVKLGQSSSTLSGGESQRVKLASFLLKEGNEPLIFIFDEPTTGLHFHDIKKLLKCFDALINKGHTIVVVEHNMEVVKCADYIIDLGAEGGDKGGELVFEGEIDKFLKTEKGYTVNYLKKLLVSDRNHTLP